MLATRIPDDQLPPDRPPSTLYGYLLTDTAGHTGYIASILHTHPWCAWIRTLNGPHVIGTFATFDEAAAAALSTGDNDEPPD
ncbi:MAG: hypothetical protein IT340_19870 [Chloroflexi bacterium]|nr:hypothetical protein [Chloroflexota bacterium]